MDKGRDTLEIGLLVYPGAQAAAVHGLTDLFAIANRLRLELGALERPALRVSHWGENEQRQLAVVFDSLAGGQHQPRVMIIPPSLTQAPSPELLERYRQDLCRWHREGALLVSVCVGVFFIAASGLLDGRPATTHWNFAQSLAERFPAVNVEANLPVLDDGDIITSAGLMAWTDLGLRLLERFLGALSGLLLVRPYWAPVVRRAPVTFQKTRRPGAGLRQPPFALPVLAADRLPAQL